MPTKASSSGTEPACGLTGRLATDLFVGAKPVRLAADEVLFLAGDPGDGCYRIEDGLLKVTMVSRYRQRTYPGVSSAPARSSASLSMIDGLPRSAVGGGGARRQR